MDAKDLKVGDIIKFAYYEKEFIGRITHKTEENIKMDKYPEASNCFTIPFKDVISKIQETPIFQPVNLKFDMKFYEVSIDRSLSNFGRGFSTIGSAWLTGPVGGSVKLELINCHLDFNKEYTLEIKEK